MPHISQTTTLYPVKNEDWERHENDWRYRLRARVPAQAGHGLFTGALAADLESTEFNFIKICFSPVRPHDLLGPHNILSLPNLLRSDVGTGASLVRPCECALVF